MKIGDTTVPTDNGLDYACLQRLDFLKIDAARFLRETGQFDICYFHKYPFNVLCNYSPTDFWFEGVHIASMEGFIQSLKCPDADIQREICQTVADDAKEMGRRYERDGAFDGRTLHWQGKRFGRESAEYKALLGAAYEARWQGDAEFRDVLRATNGYRLTHKVGKKDRHETVLTEDEFIEHLDILRDRHNDKNIALPIPQLINRYVLDDTHPFAFTTAPRTKSHPSE